tara:strand:+ start:790 stop:990 length:201 start_codon:yes stop_codon:yes gene_type:complete
MSKVKFQFVAGPSPKYRSLGNTSYEPIEVEEEELERIKSNGYKVEVLSKPKSKAVKKELKKKSTKK